MKYSVKTIRAAGLDARWSKTRNGAPIIMARYPQSQHKHQRETWWTVDRKMWEAMKQEGIVPAFERFTLLGDIFSIPA